MEGLTAVQDRELQTVLTITRGMHVDDFAVAPLMRDGRIFSANQDGCAIRNGTQVECMFRESVGIGIDLLRNLVHDSPRVIICVRENSRAGSRLWKPTLPDAAELGDLQNHVQSLNDLAGSSR